MLSLKKNYWFAITIALVFFAGVTSNVIGQELPNNYALLIGVNEYDNVSGLQFCDADAKLMNYALKEGGFPEDHIFLMTSSASRDDLKPTRANIIRMIDSMVALCQRGDVETILFYFSGHGMHGQPPEDNNDYILPKDAVLTSLRDTSLNVREHINDRLSTAGAQNMVLIFDACRNIVRPGRATAEASGFRAVAFAERQVVMSSCRPTEVSVEYPDIGDPSNSRSNAGNGHGVYTYFLAKAILREALDRGDPNTVTTASAHTYLLSEVPRYVNQHQQQVPGFPNTQTPEIATVNNASIISAKYPSLQITIGDPREGGTVQLRNEGGLYKFNVSGTSIGVDEENHVVMAFLGPNKGPDGWYLLHHPSRISPVNIRSNGRWRCRFQIGNREFPPVQGDPPIDIAVLVMTTDAAREVKEENPPGVPFGDLPSSLAEHVIWDVELEFPAGE